MHRGPDGTKTLCNACGMRLQKGKLQLYRSAKGLTAIKSEGAVPANIPLPCFTRESRPRKRTRTRSASRQIRKKRRSAKNKALAALLWDTLIDDFEDPLAALVKLEAEQDAVVPMSFSPASSMDIDFPWDDPAMDETSPYTDRFSDRNIQDIHLEEMHAMLQGETMLG